MFIQFLFKYIITWKSRLYYGIIYTYLLDVGLLNVGLFLSANDEVLLVERISDELGNPERVAFEALQTSIIKHWTKYWFQDEAILVKRTSKGTILY